MRKAGVTLTGVIVVLCLLLFPGIAHAQSLSVPCSGSCFSSVYWNQSIDGAEVSTFAYQGNLPSSSYFEQSISINVSSGGFVDIVEIGLGVSNNTNIPDCAVNTHGAVYVWADFLLNGADNYQGCTSIGSTWFNQQVYLFVNHYASGGGGVQAWLCSGRCEQGGTVIWKYQCSNANCGTFPTTYSQYKYDTLFGDLGSIYNNNSYPYDTYTDAEYQNTSGVWNSVETDATCWLGNSFLNSQ